MRIPLMQGRPLHWRGFTVMRSIKPTGLYQSAEDPSKIKKTYNSMPHTELTETTENPCRSPLTPLTPCEILQFVPGPAPHIGVAPRYLESASRNTLLARAKAPRRRSSVGLEPTNFCVTRLSPLSDE